MKIISSGKAIHTPEFHSKKRKERRIRLALVSLLVIIFVIAPLYLLRRPQFLVADIVVSGAVVVPSQDIEDVVREYLSGNYFYIIPRANALVHPRGSLERAILESIPRLKTADTKLIDKNTLSVTVTERQPFGLYCLETQATDVAADCYFLDSNGFIFARAPSFAGDVYLIYSSEDNFAEPIGKELMTSDEFASITEFIDTLGVLGIHPRAFEIVGSEYHLVLPNSARIKWKPDQNLALLRSDLEAFLGSDAISKEKDFLDRIQYLDLRTENKVFFKFQ